MALYEEEKPKFHHAHIREFYSTKLEELMKQCYRGSGIRTWREDLDRI